ncbi:hypothetical protein BN1723_003020 [Verticillium longisporum]|uniref:Uncharacterized protein n=1 Tax=Verticillium longisporum TaxID=100787 RepID=A0A0G4LNN7_VERLO|nr:hypothetical protein BN1723_003020 [Verticillium longisporum]
MDPSANSGYLVDASVAFAVVVLFQVAYFELKFWGALEVPDRSQLRILVWLCCGLGLAGLSYTVSFLVMCKLGNGSKSFATLTMWEIGSEISISCVEAFEVLYHIKHAWPSPQKRFLSFWVSLVLQSIILAVGTWKLTAHEIEVLRALPVVMHAQFSAMALEAVICKVELYAGMPWVPSWVSWIEAASGICSSAMAFGATWAPHQITVQCLACTLVISGKAFRDWLASHDGLNPPWYERPECSISEIQNDLVETAKSPKPPVSQSLGTNIELNPAHTTHSQSIPESFDAELPATPDLALNNGIVCVRTIEQVI